jgi:predicted DNA-binding transcriptional regulator YafY
VTSQIVRQWMILRLVPKHPPRIDVAGLQAGLARAGVRVHIRTIQRDLLELQTVFPIVADESMKPFGWKWAEGAEFLCSIPLLTDPIEIGPEITLSLRVDKRMARTICEGLRGREGAAREVTTTAIEHGRAVLVTARVPDTCVVRRWLLGFGEAIEVLEPSDVRAEFVAKAVRLSKTYGTYGRRSTM